MAERQRHPQQSIEEIERADESASVDERSREPAFFLASLTSKKMTTRTVIAVAQPLERQRGKCTGAENGKRVGSSPQRSDAKALRAPPAVTIRTPKTSNSARAVRGRKRARLPDGAERKRPALRQDEER
jgi:hypothetical protein